MSTTYSVQLTMTYLDATSRTYKLPVVNRPNVADVKQAVWDFNDNASISGGDLQRTFISDDNGMAVTAISEAAIIAVTEEVLYSG